MLKVKLIQYTRDCERLIASGAKLCYSNADLDSISSNLDDEGVEKFLNMLLSMGHESPIEHTTFTFGVSGVSRSLLAQLTRHRIASYTVKSQRYVKEGQFEYVVPPEIEKDEKAKKIYIETMEMEQKAYNDLTDILFEKHYNELIRSGRDEKSAKIAAEKKAIEDARYVLPNACETKIVMTMNIRSLLHFFNARCCERAQWEIRQMADMILDICKVVAPNIFAKAGASCVRGKCKEGKMCCGNPKGGK